MTKTSLKVALVALSLLFGLTGAAFADPGKGHKHKSHHEESHTGHRHGSDGFSDHDRVLIRTYLARDYHKHCPPGLAKKHNGCLPPGQAKKYRIGQILPPGIYIPVAGDLLDVLSPVPRGYQYVQVDRDVLLISEASKKVIDAVTLLSAVSN